MLKTLTQLPRDCRPLDAAEIAALPEANGRQDRVTVARCGEDWLLLSTELPGAPQPQTHRLRLLLKRQGIGPQICYTSRLQLNAYLRLYSARSGKNGIEYDEKPPPKLTIANAQDTEVASDVADLLEYAVAQNASDIHLECRQHRGVRIRLRHCGRLTDSPPALAEEKGAAMAHYLFSLGRRGNRQWQPDSPCDGVVDLNMRSGATQQLRLASLPESRGWDLIIRLFVGEDRPARLQELGYTRQQQHALQEAFSRPHGTVVFTGPTGSGKSTSMLSALNEVPGDRKIVSLEQPVERTLPGVSHVTAMDAVAMREVAPALHRWDADIAVVGEIRDAGSAAALCEFTTAGKLTVATLHASSVAAVPLRLAELGLNHSLLGDASFLAAIVNQRLLPRLCGKCRHPLVKSRLPAWWRDRYAGLLSGAGDVFTRHTEGCDACRAGVVGRVLAAEIRLLCEQDYLLLAQGKLHQWREALLRSGMKPLAGRGLELVLLGEVDPMDAARSTGLTLPEAV